MTLDELRNEAARKPQALSELSDTLVFGEGDPQARLMLVGEAPGEDEDLNGRPFVGRAGMLLDRILEAVGIERDEIYITNIVKFRPPGNRNPTAAEIEASERVLLKEIEIVAPQIIGTLGNVPTQYFRRSKEGISRCHGQWCAWRNIRIFPLYHPAYLLRNPSREQGSPKWQMWQDMKALKAALDQLDPKARGSVDIASQGALF